jgi:hypothetical protein
MNQIVKRGLPMVFADLLIVNLSFILARLFQQPSDFQGFDFGRPHSYFVLSLSL